MADAPWLWQLERSIPSDTAAATALLEELLAALRTHGWRPQDVFGIHLAVHEALVNAVLHGNRLDARKQVHVACRLSRETCRVEVADEGRGFDLGRLPDCTTPARLEAPNGRGIPLMRAFMSRVSYDGCGNKVILEKDRAARAEVAYEVTS